MQQCGVKCSATMLLSSPAALYCRQRSASLSQSSEYRLRLWQELSRLSCKESSSSFTRSIFWKKQRFAHFKTSHKGLHKYIRNQGVLITLRIFLNLSRYYINDTLLPSTVLVKDHCMSLHLLSKSTKSNLQLSRSFNDMKKNCQSNEGENVKNKNSQGKNVKYSSILWWHHRT